MTAPRDCNHEHIAKPPPGKHLRICLDCCKRLIECSSCDAKLVAGPDIGDSGWRKGGHDSERASRRGMERVSSVPGATMTAPREPGFYWVRLMGVNLTAAWSPAELFRQDPRVDVLSVRFLGEPQFWPPDVVAEWGPRIEPPPVP